MSPAGWQLPVTYWPDIEALHPFAKHSGELKCPSTHDLAIGHAKFWFNENILNLFVWVLEASRR